jgi:AAA family ATP:ADP antiporter
MPNAIGRSIGKSVDVRAGELPALVWSSAYLFFVLCAYYILRPIRDEMGVAGGVENLAWLFTGTLVGMLLIHPLFTSLVGRMPRRRFVPLTYRFFILNLVVFFLVFRAVDATQSVWVGRIFFIWVSIFNLFVVSVFWSFMTDLYRPEQSKRLFGIVAIGGTLGAVLGSSITSALAPALGPINLLLVSAIFLEVAAQASGALDREEGRLAHAAAGDSPERAVVSPRSQAPGVIGGGAFDGIRHVLASPYLLGVAMLMLLFTVTSTFLYLQQAAIVKEVLADDSEARTRLFANIDLAVSILTGALQLLVTGRILKRFGVGFALAFLPVVSVIGFSILAATPVLTVLVILQVVRRAGNYAIQRPAREVAYTVLPRTDKYKAKNFNDTFVYRVGDQVGAWSYAAMAWLGIGVSGLALTMVPLSFTWIFLALWLGRRYKAYHDAQGRAPLTPVKSEIVGS